jgi:hypothetical protein
MTPHEPEAVGALGETRPDGKVPVANIVLKVAHAP